MQTRPLEPKEAHQVAWGLALVFVKATIWVLIAASLLVLLALIVGKTESPGRLIGPSLLLVFCTLSLWRITRGEVRQGLRWLLTGTWLIVTAVLYCFGGVRGTLVVVYPLIVIVCGCLLGTRSALVVTALSG